MYKTATIILTETMLNKSIIDANKSVCDFAQAFDFNYSEADAGEKVQLVGQYADKSECKVNFYKAKGRGDKRISITNLKKHAKAGDMVVLRTRTKGRKDNSWQIAVLINEGEYPIPIK